MSMSSPSKEEVRQQLGPLDGGESPLERLADVLLEQCERREERRGLTGSDQPVIVSFIGAGASRSAGLPSATELKEKIYDKLVPRNEAKGTFAEALDAEARDRFDQSSVLNLSLFQFSSVVSLLAYGRKVIPQVVSEELGKAKFRPLAYELLAHLTKHGFIDHFVSMNFDELLDHALHDELPDRLLPPFTSSDELPGEGWLAEPEEQSVLLVKPFGSLSSNRYCLTPDETKRYGSDPVAKFMLKHVFGDRDAYLLLIGYAAEEEAFGKLVGELRSGEQRKVTLFVINPECEDKLSCSLKSFNKNDPDAFHHIQLPADLAFDLLLQIIEIKHRENRKIWIPVDRHKVISYCLDLGQGSKSLQPRADHQFEVELILQAVKSRGFFNVEAVADIGRIQKYAKQAAKQGSYPSNIIKDMHAERILEPIPWRKDKNATDSQYLYQNYRLSLNYEDNDIDYRDLATRVLGRISEQRPLQDIDEWTVKGNSGSGWDVEVREIKYKDFLTKRFKNIEPAPEIEVVDTVGHANSWLFRRPEPLWSVNDITKNIEEVFGRVFEAVDTLKDKIEFYGTWEIGEWLFHEDGWAWKSIRPKIEELLSQDKLDMYLVFAKIPPTHGIRRKRTDAVHELLKEYIEKGYLKQENLFELDWWYHNRVLTLLRWRTMDAPDQWQADGIYMQRRHVTPLVAPVRVSDEEDCEVLLEIFDLYRHRAREQAGDTQALQQQ